MKIADIQAIPIFVPVEFDIVGVRKNTDLSMCLVKVETDTGPIGWGMTAITEEEVIAKIINGVVAQNLIGEDALAYERVWHKLYWLLSPRGQTGYASHAIAAIDTALWDIMGQHHNEPVWRLLGGARDQVPLYATFGFSFLDREHLAQAAKLWVSQGFKRLKMTVGDSALRLAGRERPIEAVLAEDIARIKAVRDAVGPDIALYIDANCNLDLYHAAWLAKRIEEFDVGVFEEPVTQNDVPSMVQLRQRTSIPLCCGQNEGLSFRFRDLLTAQAVDIVQPNVVISGGFTQCVKIAGMAAAFNIAFANGGAWPYHNMHIHAGLSNGGLVEYHYLAVECCRAVYAGLPAPENGHLRLPGKPGLGFAPDPTALKELSKRPTSAGSGKG